MADSTTARIEDLIAHADWVRRLAHSLVRDPATADDVVQETFVAALERPPKARSVRAWLSGVVRNRAKMRHRGDFRRTRRETAVAESRGTVPSTDDVVGKMETQRLLAEAVLALDEPYRSTVLLRHLEGLSSAEIAAEQGVPAATVRGRLKRGLELLRTELDQRHGGDRRLWLNALSPFLAPDAIGQMGSSLLSNLLQGVLLMNTTTKIAAAAMLLTLAVVAAFALDILQFSSAETEAGPGPVALHGDDPDPDAAKPVLVGRERLDTAGDADATANQPGVGTPPPGPTPPTSLVVRFIDSAGRAVDNVRLVCSNPANTPESASDRDGRLRWRIDSGGVANGVTWHVIAPGYATRTLRAKVDPDARLDLGDVELAPGGAAEGVVFDPEGRPLAGARVVAAEPGVAGDERRTLIKGPLHPELALDTTTDERGAFRLGGLPVGFVRVWASAGDMRFASTPAIEIGAGTTQGGLELHLTRRQPEDTVEGRVVGPDGEPAANVQMSYRYRYDRGSSSSTLHLDDDGRFRITTWAPGTVDISAWNAEGLRAKPRDGIKPGTHDIVLELRALRTAALSVVDQDGKPLPTFVANVLGADGYTPFDTITVRDQADGRGELSVPPEAFHVQVVAEGHTRVLTPLLQPDAVPHPIEVRLERLAGVTGSVRSASGPVAGAVVTLYRIAADDEKIEVDGFRAHVHPRSVAAARTDGKGHFRLDLRKAGHYVLRADAEGFAATELADLTLAPTEASGPFDLVLDGGGRIQGMVRVSGSRSAAGLIVGATRGDAHPISVRAQEDGTFGFDALTPGPWQVRLIEEELIAGSHSTSIMRGARPRPMTWTCEVVAGETTEVELTKGGEQQVTLLGSLKFDGEGAKGWRAHIMPMPEAGGMIGSALQTASVSEDGVFSLSIDEPGKYVVRLEPADGSAATAFLMPLDLVTGDNHWSLDATTGIVAGTKGEQALPRGEVYLYVWKGARGLIGVAPVKPDADGRFELIAVAGPGRIVHMDRDAMMQMATVAIPDPWSWRLIAEIDVPERETVEVELP